MFRAILLILQQYGLQTANLCLLIFVSYKLANNHLRHISDAIKNNSTKLEKIDNKVDKLGERISKVEGKLE